MTTIRIVGLAFSLLLAGIWLACSGDNGGSSTDAGVGTDAGSADTGPRTDGGTLDSGAPDSGSSVVPCGNVTLFGECDGSTLRFCDDSGGEPTLVTLACPDNSQQCGLVDCLDPATCWGYDCVQPSGGACSAGDSMFCNASAGEGCLKDVCATSTTCTAGPGADSCSLAVLIYCATFGGTQGMVWSLDCSSNGADPYTCGPDSQQVPNCLGLAGAECEPGYVDCVAGLSCTGGVCGSPDGGTADGGTADGGTADGA